MPPKSKKDDAKEDLPNHFNTLLKKIPQLENLSDYHLWIDAVDDVLFGMHQEQMIKNSKLPEPVQHDDCPDAVRRTLWVTIKQALPPEILHTILGVQRPNVEQLLSNIKKYFYDDSPHTRHAILKRVNEAKLQNHSDLNTYITYMELQKRTLKNINKPIDPDIFLYYLLQGLPNDYASIKQSINMPTGARDPLTYL